MRKPAACAKRSAATRALLRPRAFSPALAVWPALGAIPCGVAQAGVQGPIDVSAGNAQTLRIERSPFKFALVNRRGRETVSSVTGIEGPPVRVPGIDGPQPFEPLGPAGGFPAMGFVFGTRAGVAFPLPVFTGNRLFGAESGAIVSAGIGASRLRGTRSAGREP